MMKPSPVPAIAATTVLAVPACVGTVYTLLAAVRVVGPGATGLDLAPVSAVLTSADTWRSVGWTISTAAMATLLSVVVAAAVAIGVRESRVWRFVALLPLATPHVAAALAAVLVLGQAGLLSRIAFGLGAAEQPADFPPLVYDRRGVALILAFAWKEIPYLTLTAMAVLASGAVGLHDAARTLGATARQTLLRVTWPLLWRGMAPAAIAVFAFLVGQYEMPSLLAPSNPLPLSLLTYERLLHPDLSRRAEAHVLSLLAMLLAALAVWGHLRLSHCREDR